MTLMSSACRPRQHASVSWFDWTPDPERASRAHDPGLEPYASMTKEQLLEAMMDARGGSEWDFLQEYYLDRCTEAELAVGRTTFVREQFAPVGEELLGFLSGVAGTATRVAGGGGERGVNERGHPGGSSGGHAEGGPGRGSAGLG
jgi:hypothetical protein